MPARKALIGAFLALAMKFFVIFNNCIFFAFFFVSM